MLVAQGWDVRALHRSPRDAERLRAIGAQPVKGELNDVSALRVGVAGPEVVFHAAALFKMWAPRADFERANIEGTQNLLAAAQAEHVKRFIQIGAAGAHMGDRKPMYTVTEDAPLGFPSWAPYLASKARAQDLVLSANRPGGMQTAVILPPLIWGPDMPMLEGVIADVEAGRFAWPAGGTPLVSTAHVDNVCHCALLAAERSPGGRAYFLTDGEDRTIRKVITELLATRGVDAKGRDVPVGFAWFLATLMEGAWKMLSLKGQPPLTRQMLRMVGYDFTLSDQRARTELGYRPIVQWQEGIKAI
jgi:nucleoside-diphosphate-sugar epimerase